MEVLKARILVLEGLISKLTQDLTETKQELLQLKQGGLQGLHSQAAIADQLQAAQHNQFTYHGQGQNGLGSQYNFDLCRCVCHMISSTEDQRKHRSCSCKNRIPG